MLQATTTLYVDPHELMGIFNNGSKKFILAVTQPFGQFTQAINIPLKQIIIAQGNNHNHFGRLSQEELNSYLEVKKIGKEAISNGMVYKIKKSAFTVLIPA